MGEDAGVVGVAGMVKALRAAASQVAGPQRGSEAATVSAIVAAAAEVVPGAEQAGVSLLHRDGTITSEAVSDEAIADVDQLQATYREGPCVTALWDEHTVSVEDVAAEADRWPRFAPQAASAGVGSMLSFQLFTRASSLGALNLYSATPKSFTAESQTIGELFAMQAAASLGEARHVVQLHQALETRDLIGQAKGVLMERFNIDGEQAFELLVRSSQDTNLKLTAVARWLTGDNRQGHQP